MLGKTMPVRLLKSSLRTSERWHRARYFDRCFYISLLNLVDDYGRYEGNPTLLASECFPYGDENGLPVTPLAIDGVLRSLADKDLIIVYKLDGKQFIAITRWDERIRSKPKYPAPDDEKCEIVWKSVNGWQPPANDSKCQQVLASPPSPSPSPTPTPTPQPRQVCASADKQMEARKADFQAKTSFDHLQSAICELYGRPVKVFGISSEEHHLLAEIACRPTSKAELATLRRYHDCLPPKDRRYFPNSAVRLLQTWDSTLDRARNHQPDRASKTLAEKQFDAACKEAARL